MKRIHNADPTRCQSAAMRPRSAGASRLTAVFGMLLIPALVMAQAPAFIFKDVGPESGLFPHLDKIEGHAAGWGDVDGDGFPELYVGTFWRKDGPPNQLFRNHKGKFTLDPQPQLRIKARANSGLFADLDNDGDLDLYASSMPQAKNDVVGCSLFRNEGKGEFTDITKDNGACPQNFGGRSATVLDFDGDGLLDLLVGEDPLPGYNGSKTTSSRLFRNRGGLKFEDVSQAVGLPADIPGLGVAVGDVNGDGWPDFFLASGRGGNRLFLNDGKGKFAEAPGTRDVFDWTKVEPVPKGDDTPCGVTMVDINRDGLLDIVIGHHFQRPWNAPVYNRVYLNRGVKNGQVVFEDVTHLVGFVPLPMKAPHVEVQDFDNDGWPDIFASLIVFSDNRPHPLIYRHLGIKDGLPRFEQKVLGLTDFPTAEDKAIAKVGTFFDKMIKDKKVLYSAPCPSADFDRDGRLDLFLANWWQESPSLLLRNETPGGRWLEVSVAGPKGVNRMGIGAVVRIFPAGKGGDAAALLGHREIAAGFGYTSGQEAIAHFGLGTVEAVDLEIKLPHGKGTIVRKNVPGNQRIQVEQ